MGPVYFSKKNGCAAVTNLADSVAKIKLSSAFLSRPFLLFSFSLYAFGMIAYLSGTVLEKEAKSLIVLAGGVGYRVAAAPNVLEAAQTGETITLYIHHHVGAEAEELYGFASREELRHFDLLLTVPSVGPRTALGILYIAPPPVLAQAVAEQDTALLTKVSGVGKKTAERILIELAGKLQPSEAAGPAGAVQREAVEALVSLGYTLAAARSAVQDLPRDTVTVEDAVRHVLQTQHQRTA